MNDNDGPERGAAPERARKLILCVSASLDVELKPLVAQWQRDRIAWIAVIGAGCIEIERRIKSLLIADAANRAHFVMVTSHPTETIEEVADFMLSLVGEYEGDVAIVEI
jgi:hypothetical protein